MPGKDTILGVTIVGTHAGDLLAEYVLAMRHGLGLNKILSTIHTYPTLAEANAAEGVPAPRLLTPGEQAMLQLHGVTPYAASLQTARRESRAPRKDARERELGG